MVLSTAGITDTGNFSQTGTGTFSTGTGAVSINGAAIASSTLAVQGAGGLTVGVAGITNGLIKIANATNSQLTVVQALAPTGTGDATINFPSIAGGAIDEVCLKLSG